MSRLDYITLVTQATTIDDSSNIYLVNATGTTGFNLTLPLIGGSDGINYSVVREDITTAIIMVMTTSPNLIYRNLSGLSGSTGMTGITLRPQTRMHFHSYQDNWYLSANTAIERVSSKTLFTTAFSSSSGPFLTLGATAGQTGPVCYFTYIGRSLEVMSQFEILISNGSTGTTGTIQLWNSPGGIPTLQIASINVPPSTNVATFTTSTLSNLPNFENPLQVIFVGTGTGSNAMNIYSLIVR